MQRDEEKPQLVRGSEGLAKHERAKIQRVLHVTSTECENMSKDW